MMKKPVAYLTRVATLFADVAQWVATKGWYTERDTVELNEEEYGQYLVDTLRLISPEGKKIAEMVPVGASIIGARGRIDLVGTIDQEILVDWDKGGPRFINTITVDDHIETQPTYLYRGVNEAGWYWVESRKLARAHKLDERLFFDLLLAVSDHDLRS